MEISQLLVVPDDSQRSHMSGQMPNAKRNLSTNSLILQRKRLMFTKRVLILSKSAQKFFSLGHHPHHYIYL
jgi:hypothetical protein